MFEKFRHKSFPRFYLRPRLDEYDYLRERRSWEGEGNGLSDRNSRALFDLFPFSVLKEMHSFLLFKVTLALSLILLVFLLTLINLPFSQAFRRGVHYVTTWQADFIALGKEMAPVVKSLWEGDPEGYLDVWAPIIGGGGEEGGIDCFSMPIEGRVIKNFGYGYNPKLQTNDLTYGLLFSAPGGRDIVAAAPGKVQGVKNDPYYGLLIVLEHSGKVETCYGYLGETLVSEGERVSRGEKIACAGPDPEAQVSYLYFEVRENGRPFDPLPFFAAPSGH